MQTAEIMDTTPVGVSLAISKGARRGWVTRLAEQLGLPVEVLLDLAPFDPLVLPWQRRRAIERSAQWRLELYLRMKQRGPDKIGMEQLAA